MGHHWQAKNDYSRSASIVNTFFWMRPFLWIIRLCFEIAGQADVRMVADSDFEGVVTTAETAGSDG
jgi:hypothetical protein